MYGFALRLEHVTGAVSEWTETKLVVPRPRDLEPPVLVAVEPDVRTSSLAPDTPVTLVFSERMSFASLTVDVAPPRALDAPAWDVEGQRVTLRPAVPWVAGTRYVLSVDAEDLAGNTLTSTTVEVVTGLSSRAPELTGFSPHDGMAVPATARISVSFDEEMDEQSVIRAFEVHPSPSCLTTADAPRRTFTCTPAEPLTPGRIYGVLVRTTARSRAGVALARESGITFTVATEASTTAPALVRVTPEPGARGVGRHFELALTFDTPMDRAATEAALSFPSDPALTGDFTWDTDGQTLRFTPDVDPPHGTHVAWRLGTRATCVGGVALTSTASGTFHVARRERRTLEPVVGLGGSIATTPAGDVWVDEGASIAELGRVERRTQSDTVTSAVARGFLSFDLATLPEALTTVISASLELVERHRTGACTDGMGWSIERIEGGPVLGTSDFSEPTATHACTTAPDCPPFALTVVTCPEALTGASSHDVSALVAADWDAREAQSYLTTLRFRMALEDEALRHLELLTAHPWVPERFRPKLVVEYEVP